jgi:holo-[acyl-carrier protein] synthase
MAIVSIGSDLCQISRIADVLKRRGEGFCDRIYSDTERAYCDARPRSRATHYAGRFAVKEAVMKALGTGWRSGVRWVDIETLRESGQAPTLELHGRTKELALERGITRWHLTITHDAGLALAFVVAESGS